MLQEGLPLSAVCSSAVDQRVRLCLRRAHAGANDAGGHGVRCVLVSGGFTFFTERAAEAAWIPGHQRANRFVERGETLAGRVEEPILGREAKA